VLKWLGLGGLAALLGGGATAMTPRRANAYYSGPVSDHFDGVRFFNPTGPGPKSLGQLLKWQFGSRAEAWPATFPSAYPPAVPAARLAPSQTRVTHIGHASHLIQTAGLNILCDPVYSQRVSPVTFAGPKRVNDPGIAFDALPKIDVVLVSHNHYDHMDTATLGRLLQRDKPRFIMPLGNDAIIRGDVPDFTAETLDWNGSLTLADGATLHCVPTQHWSARGTRDRMHALWSSFVMAGSAHTVYFVGDTGFGDGSTFRNVAAKHPGIDLAILPIGAYEPRWFMRDQHMNPMEAVEALKLCGAKRAIGHHWGTFKLTNESVEAPRRDLDAALTAASLPSERFLPMQPGRVINI
jgi:L-ascorbate metabolism protein UlaG (beta-lactamase superfamily)